MEIPPNLKAINNLPIQYHKDFEILYKACIEGLTKKIFPFIIPATKNLQPLAMNLIDYEIVHQIIEKLTRSGYNVKLGYKHNSVKKLNGRECIVATPYIHIDNAFYP